MSKYDVAAFSRHGCTQFLVFRSYEIQEFSCNYYFLQKYLIKMLFASNSLAYGFLVNVILIFVAQTSINVLLVEKNVNKT
jgi:hypothetical protein